MLKLRIERKGKLRLLLQGALEWVENRLSGGSTANEFGDDVLTVYFSVKFHFIQR